MTDLASVRRKVQSEETDFRSALSESTMQKMGSAVNWVIDNSTFQVGDVIMSVLSEADFQSLRDTNWVLCDGRSVIGTDYASQTGDSNIPDARARFPRMKDNGAGRDPNGDPALGSSFADTFLSHDHALATSWSENLTGSGFTSWDYQYVNIATQAAPVQTRTTGTGPTVNYTNNVVATAGGSGWSPKSESVIQSNGGNETRPDTIIFNFFIKINE